MNPDFSHHQPHSMHQHQPHCKQTCFVFTEIADIELPPEITKFTSEKINMKTSDLMNGGISSAYKNKESMAGSNTQHHQQPKMPSTSSNSKSRKMIVILGAILICVAMAGGIPLALQLRSSSLLEARVAFIRRLLTEAPLIEGYWSVKKESNFSTNIIEVRKNLVGAVLWPISVPCGAQYLDAVQLALEGIDKAKRLTAKAGYMRIVESSDEMEQTHLKGEVAILMGLGGGHALGSSLAVLRSMYMLGTRFVSITSFGCTTPWAGAAIKNDFIVEDNSTTNSLTGFGKTVLYEMNRLGMLVEISQMSETAMVAALKTARAPVLLLNAAPLSLCNSTNLAPIPDNILSLLQDNGGVIMLNMEKCGDRQLTIREAINAINYVRKIAGVDHIGLSGAPKSYTYLLAELARDRIWGNAYIKKLVGGNVVRILREVETLKDRLPLYENLLPHKIFERNSYCRYEDNFH